MKSVYRDSAIIFKALCDENRLMILKQLQSGEKSTCDILDGLEIVQSTFSHHMRVLIDSGIVKGRRDGRCMFYSFNKTGIEKAKETLEKVTYIIK